MVRRAVSFIELDRRGGERAGEITGRGISGAAKTRLGFDRGIFRRREVEGAVGGNVIDLHELGGGARLFERFGDHKRNRLMIMLDLWAAEEMGRIAIGLFEL